MIANIDEDKGRLVYQYAVDRPVHEERVSLVDRGGIKVEEVEIRTRFVREFRQATVAFGAIETMDGAGNRLDRSEGLKRLSVGAMVLHSRDANGVDAAYRKLLARDALILVQVEPAGRPPAR
jgi:hypothetical protein